MPDIKFQVSSTEFVITIEVALVFHRESIVGKRYYTC